MKNPVDALTDLMVKENIIEDSKRELYQYGNYLLLASFLVWGSLLVISIFAGCVIGALLFALFFLPLRGFAGGYHLRSAAVCNLVSICIFSAILFVSKIGLFSIYLIIGGAAASMITTYILAPIGDENKPLDEKETITYRKKARTVATAEFVLILILCGLGFIDISFFCFAGMAIPAVLLILGYAKMVRGGRN